MLTHTLHTRYTEREDTREGTCQRKVIKRAGKRLTHNITVTLAQENLIERTPPPLGFFFLGGSQRKSPEKEDLSSSSGLFIWEPPKNLSCSSALHVGTTHKRNPPGRVDVGKNRKKRHAMYRYGSLQVCACVCMYVYVRVHTESHLWAFGDGNFIITQHIPISHYQPRSDTTKGRYVAGP